MMDRAESTRQIADLVIAAQGAEVRVFKPNLSSAQRVEALLVEPPARLLLALVAEREGSPSGAADELNAWLQGTPPLFEAVAAARGPRSGSLVALSVSHPLLRQPLLRWWFTLGGRLVPVPAAATSPRALRAFRAIARLQVGWRRTTALALSVSSLVFASFATVQAARAFDDFCYAFASLGLPRPALVADAEVLLLPRVSGELGRTPRALLASVLSVALEQGAAVVGLDAMLDGEGDPDGAAALAALLAAHRDHVVAVEYPESMASPGFSSVLVSEPFYSALCDPDQPRCGARPGVAPVSYGGVFDPNPGGTLHRTRLFFDEGLVNRGQPEQPTAARWGEGVLPVLGTEVYRRWCAARGDCWALVGAWERPLRLRFPEVPTPLRLLNADQDTPDEIRDALARQQVVLRGKALFVSSWDPVEDAVSVPVLDQLGEAGRPGQWPGVLVQAAVFHTLAARDPLWDLRDRVDQRLGLGAASLVGGGVVWLWLSLWALVGAFGALVGLRGRWLVPGLSLGLSLLCWGLLSGGSLWLPLPASVLSVFLGWLLVTLRQRPGT